MEAVRAPNPLFEIKLMRAVLSSGLVESREGYNASMHVFNRFIPSEEFLVLCHTLDEQRRKLTVSTQSYQRAKAAFDKVEAQRVRTLMVHQLFHKADWMSARSERSTTLESLRRRFEQLNRLKEHEARDVALACARFLELKVYDAEYTAETTVKDILKMSDAELRRDGFGKEIILGNPFDSSVIESFLLGAKSTRSDWLAKIDLMEKECSNAVAVEEGDEKDKQRQEKLRRGRVARSAEVVIRMIHECEAANKQELATKWKASEVWRGRMERGGEVSFSGTSCTVEQLLQEVEEQTIGMRAPVLVLSPYAQKAQELAHAEMQLRETNMDLIKAELKLFDVRLKLPMKDEPFRGWILERERDGLNLLTPEGSHPMLAWLREVHKTPFNQPFDGPLTRWRRQIAPTVDGHRIGRISERPLPEPCLAALRAKLIDLKSELLLGPQVVSYLSAFTARHNEWPLLCHAMYCTDNDQLAVLLNNEFAALYVPKSTESAMQESPPRQNKFSFTQLMKDLAHFGGRSSEHTDRPPEVGPAAAKAAEEPSAQVAQLLSLVHKRCEKLLRLAEGLQPSLSPHLRRCSSTVRAVHEERLLDLDESVRHQARQQGGEAISPAHLSVLLTKMYHLIGAALAMLEALVLPGVFDRVFFAPVAAGVTSDVAEHLHALHLQLSPGQPRPAAIDPSDEIGQPQQLLAMASGGGDFAIGGVSLSEAKVTLRIHEGSFEPARFHRLYYTLTLSEKDAEILGILPSAQIYLVPPFTPAAPLQPRHPTGGARKIKYAAFIPPLRDELAEVDQARLRHATYVALKGNAAVALALWGGFVFLTKDGESTGVYSFARGSELQFEPLSSPAALSDLADRFEDRYPNGLPRSSDAGSALFFDEVLWSDPTPQEAPLPTLAVRIKAGSEHHFAAFALTCGRELHLTLSENAAAASRQALGAATTQSISKLFLSAGGTVGRIRLEVAARFGLPLDEQKLLLFNRTTLSDDAVVMSDVLDSDSLGRNIGPRSSVEIVVYLR